MEGETAHFGQRHDETGLVAALAEFGGHAEAGRGPGMADQGDEGFPRLRYPLLPPASAVM